MQRVYVDICEVCGSPSECTHHLIFGTGNRKKSDDAGLTMRLCNECHNMAVRAQDRIHGNGMAEKLSKMLGQALWELNRMPQELRDKARSDFMKEFYRSWL